MSRKHTYADLVFLLSTNNFILSFFLPGGVGGVEVEEQRRLGVEAHLNKAEFSWDFNSLVWVLFFFSVKTESKWSPGNISAVMKAKHLPEPTRTTKPLSCSFPSHIPSCKKVDLALLFFRHFSPFPPDPSISPSWLDPPPPSGLNPGSTLKKPSLKLWPAYYYFFDMYFPYK